MPDTLPPTADSREFEHRNLHAFVMSAPAALCILRGPQHRFEVANETYRRVVGGRDVVGMTVREALPELEGQGFYELHRSRVRDGGALHRK